MKPFWYCDKCGKQFDTEKQAMSHMKRNGEDHFSWGIGKEVNAFKG